MASRGGLKRRCPRNQLIKFRIKPTQAPAQFIAFGGTTVLATHMLMLKKLSAKVACLGFSGPKYISSGAVFTVTVTQLSRGTVYY